MAAAIRTNAQVHEANARVHGGDTVVSKVTVAGGDTVVPKVADGDPTSAVE